jgi:hypothetical protein
MFTPACRIGGYHAAPGKTIPLREERAIVPRKSLETVRPF